VQVGTVPDLYREGVTEQIMMKLREDINNNVFIK
jgi:hypothetical protein